MHVGPQRSENLQPAMTMFLSCEDSSLDIANSLAALV